MREPATSEERKIVSAAPENWYLGPLSMIQNFDPRPGYPEIEYEVEARTGRQIGDRVRRIEVSLRAVSLDDMEQMVRSLSAFEVAYTYGIGAEVSVSASNN